MSAKIQEAEEHIRAAEKHLKTSVMKWRPDYDSASHEYSQAAQCYRIARQLKKSKECHIKASEYHLKNRSFFHAAKSLENAVLVDKENATADELYSLALEASNFYQQHGSADSAANILAKTARILEENHAEKAYNLFQMAAEVSSSGGSSHQGIEYTGKATRLLVRLGLYDQAADSVRQEIGYHLETSKYRSAAVGRLTVAAVLIQLARGDIVAAEKTYKEWGSNCEVAEIENLERLLTAYDEEDREGAQKALASPFIRSMDVEYARLATIVELPKGEPMPSVGVRKNAAPCYVSGQAGPATASASFQATAEVSHHRNDEVEESPYAPVTFAKPAADAEDDENDFC